MKEAIVLCSGGLDSIVTAHYVKRKLKYNKVTILFFNYGQRALVSERKFSMDCAKSLGAEFIEIKLEDLAKISKSLINIKRKTSKLKRGDLKDTRKESKKWYVPFRNTLFLSYALSLAESKFIKNKVSADIFVGFKNEGKEHYPDTSKEYLSKFNALLREAGGKGKIIAPLVNMDKEDIIELGSKLGVDFSKTTSCYTGSEQCGSCLGCMLRKEGFHWANIKDPTKYAGC